MMHCEFNSEAPFREGAGAGAQQTSVEVRHDDMSTYGYGPWFAHRAIIHDNEVLVPSFSYHGSDYTNQHNFFYPIPPPYGGPVGYYTPFTQQHHVIFEDSSDATSRPTDFRTHNNSRRRNRDPFTTPESHNLEAAANRPTGDRRYNFRRRRNHSLRLTSTESQNSTNNRTYNFQNRENRGVPLTSPESQNSTNNRTYNFQNRENRGVPLTSPESQNSTSNRIYNFRSRGNPRVPLTSLESQNSEAATETNRVTSNRRYNFRRRNRVPHIPNRLCEISESFNINTSNRIHGSSQGRNQVPATGSRRPESQMYFEFVDETLNRRRVRWINDSDSRFISVEDNVAVLEEYSFGENLIIDLHHDVGFEDPMSYEDLLHFGDVLGVVSTGLAKEDIISHLKTKPYSATTCNRDQSSCTICQDEYEEKDTVGILECGHEYHQDCLTKWLQVKNVCPLCKSTAMDLNHA